MLIILSFLEQVGHCSLQGGWFTAGFTAFKGKGRELSLQFSAGPSFQTNTCWLGAHGVTLVIFSGALTLGFVLSHSTYGTDAIKVLWRRRKKIFCRCALSWQMS